MARDSARVAAAKAAAAEAGDHQIAGSESAADAGSSAESHVAPADMGAALATMREKARSTPADTTAGKSSSVPDMAGRYLRLTADADAAAGAPKPSRPSDEMLPPPDHGAIESNMGGGEEVDSTNSGTDSPAEAGGGSASDIWDDISDSSVNDGGAGAEGEGVVMTYDRAEWTKAESQASGEEEFGSIQEHTRWQCPGGRGGTSFTVSAQETGVSPSSSHRKS